MYSKRLLDHFNNPRNAGEFAAPAVSVEVSNPACGDLLRVWARIEDGQVAEVRFKAHGCTALIAAGSALTEWLAGKRAKEIAHLEAAQIEEALDGLPPASGHAAALAAEAALRLAATMSEDKEPR